MTYTKDIEVNLKDDLIHSQTPNIKDIIDILDGRMVIKAIWCTTQNEFDFLADKCPEMMMVCLAVEQKVINFEEECRARQDILRSYTLNEVCQYAIDKANEILWKEWTKEKDDQGLSLTKAYFPGNEEIPLTFQREITNRLQLNNYGIMLTEQLMFYPLHTITYILGVGKGFESPYVCHQCSDCSMKEGCRMRKVKVEIKGTVNKILRVNKGSILLDVLRNNGMRINAPCNGKKTCGKCLVKIIENPPSPNEHDLKFLSEKQLLAGYRLSCSLVLNDDITIMFDEEPMKILDKVYMVCDEVVAYGENEYGIAVDIGTTTVVLYLIDLHHQTVVDKVSEMNAQRSIGADVTSRIQYCIEEENGTDMLHQLIVEQIRNMCIQSLEQSNLDKDAISKGVICGNTTMMHLLAGIHPGSMGYAPYDVPSKEAKIVAGNELGLPIQGNIILLPNASAYIGSDVVSGAFALNMHHQKEISLLIDLGTNGEMVIGNQHKLIACSTAAGPAFEGANIEKGVGSINGAISHFKIEDSKKKYTTIGEASPIGICGSGVLEIASELLKNSLIDETGRLLIEDEKYWISNKEEEIYFTQKDIRELQLAKSAIASGINILINRYGLSDLSLIDQVYIAGGFGNYMDIDSAINIGLIPKELEDKINSVGNSALSGTIKCLLNEKYLEDMKRLSESTEVIDLGLDQNFQLEFMNNMTFNQQREVF